MDDYACTPRMSDRKANHVFQALPFQYETGILGEDQIDRCRIAQQPDHMRRLP